MIDIEFSPHFFRALKRLQPETLEILREQTECFQKNPRDPLLHTKSLSGTLKGYWSFRLGRNHRVLYRQLSSSLFLFYDVDDRKNIYS